MWLQFYSTIFCILGVGGIRGRDFTALVFSWKGSPAVFLPWKPARTWGMAWGQTLSFPVKFKGFVYSKHPQLIPSRKLQRFHGAHPWELLTAPMVLQKCPFCVLFPALLLWTAARQQGQHLKRKSLFSFRATLLGCHVQELSQPTQFRIPLCVCRQYFALVCFNESQKKKQKLHYIFHFPL